MLCAGVLLSKFNDLPALISLSFDSEEVEPVERALCSAPAAAVHPVWTKIGHPKFFRLGLGWYWSENLGKMTPLIGSIFAIFRLHVG